ncbi:hypothetical protein RFI_21092, partial [Reticulomyxa filosa]
SLDEEDISFLEGIEREEKAREALRKKQIQQDIDEFNVNMQSKKKNDILTMHINTNAVRNRLIKEVSDSHLNEDSTQPIVTAVKKSNNLIIAPSVAEKSGGHDDLFNANIVLKKRRKKRW